MQGTRFSSHQTSPPRARPGHPRQTQALLPRGRGAAAALLCVCSNPCSASPGFQTRLGVSGERTPVQLEAVAGSPTWYQRRGEAHTASAPGYES